MRICLCGSTKYKDDYNAVNLALTKFGHTVYSVAGFGHSGDTLTDEDKIILDLVHLDKIMRSECIVIVGIDDRGVPYTGFSTKREMLWAKLQGRDIFFQRVSFKDAGFQDGVARLNKEIMEVCRGRTPNANM